MMSETIEIPLNKNSFIPVLGLGTWQLSGNECETVVKKALELGYRHIDTAIMYENQREIGRAIKNIDREELFLTSKVPHTDLEKDSFMKSAESILKDLDTDYIDLLLVHWPNSDIDMSEPLSALADLVESKKVRAAGVSNFTIDHLEQALELDIVKITNNQVECHPYLPQQNLHTYCEKHDISLTAYSPLARGDVNDDATLKAIAAKYGKTTAEVSLRWLIARNIIAIPKASSVKHLEENLDVLRWQLTPEDVERINDIDHEERKIEPEWAEFDQSDQRV